MFFSVNTFLWTSPFSTEKDIELLKKVKAMGFDGIEIAVEDVSLIDVKLLKSVLNDNNLKINICGAFGPDRDFTHSDLSVQNNTKLYIYDCFKINEILQAPFFAGPMYAMTGKARQLSTEERKKERDLAIKNIKEVAKIASDYNVTLAIEPLNRFETDMINSTESACQFVDEIESLNVGLMLDSFHMNIEDRDMEEAIVLANDKIKIFQVSDSHRGIPGDGHINWNKIKSGLKKN